MHIKHCNFLKKVFGAGGLINSNESINQTSSLFVAKDQQISTQQSLIKQIDKWMKS